MDENLNPNPARTLTPPPTPAQPVAGAVKAGSSVGTPAPVSAPQPDPAPPPVNSPLPKHDQDCSGCLKSGLPMTKSWLSFLVVAMIGLSTLLLALWVNAQRQITSLSPAGQSVPVQEKAQNYVLPAPKTYTQMLPLPQPRLTGALSLEAVVNSRRSRRVFAADPVTLAELGQILWAMQGLTGEEGLRAAPSARNIYPYTIYLVIRSGSGIDPGLYEYLPEQHQLGSLGVANAGELLATAEVQAAAQESPVVLLLSASFAKAAEKFPDDPRSVTLLEGGHIGQNAYLQVESLGMSMVVMAGFDSAKVVQALGLDPAEEIIYLLPLGHRSTEPVEE